MRKSILTESQFNFSLAKAKKQSLISPEEAMRLGFAVPEEDMIYGEFVKPKNVGKAYKVFFLG